MSPSFKAAVESRDLQAIVGTLAPDVVFRSPAVYKPYKGRDAVGALLAAVSTVFEDFRYTTQIDDGEREVLIFEARVGDREVQGADILRFGDEGLVAELTVMIRPMSGLLALADAMQERLSAGSF
ncbi:MAG: nuclear transport factor 2 family protein [Actinomycetota bacterium]